MKGKLSLTLALIILVSVAALHAAHGETRRADAGQEALAKAQYLLQQMAAERDALKEKNTQLQGKVDALQARVRHLEATVAKKKKDLSARGNELARYKERSKLLMDRLMQLRDKFKEVIAKFRETIGNLRRVEMQRNQLKTSLQDRTHEVQACIAKNIDLYKADLDLLKQYQHKGIWAALLQKDPVTGLKRVEVENAVQKYQTRLEKLRAMQPVRESARN